MLDSGAHGYEGSVMNGWSLDDGIGANEYMITNGNISGDVDTILNDGIVADLNFFITNQGGSVPDGWLLTCWDVSDDGGIGGDEIGLFELRFVILKGKISQAGDHSVLGGELSFDLGTDLVELSANISQDRASEFLLDVDHDFVNDVFHFSLFIIDDL